MGKKGITERQVFDAIDILLASGETPTATSIRHHLGTGSLTTISMHLNTWKNTRQPAEAPIEPPPIAALRMLLLPDNNFVSTSLSSRSASG